MSAKNDAQTENEILSWLCDPNTTDAMVKAFSLRLSVRAGNTLFALHRRASSDRPPRCLTDARGCGNCTRREIVNAWSGDDPSKWPPGTRSGQRGIPCPCCDVEKNVKPILALAIGAGLGAAFGDLDPITERMCSNHRGTWLAALTLAQIQLNTTEDPCSSAP